MAGLGYSSERFILAIALLVFITPTKSPVDISDSRQDKADHYIAKYATQKSFISFNTGVLHNIYSAKSTTGDFSKDRKLNYQNSDHAKLYVLVILLSGDVHPCPGPRKPQNPCGICSRGVRSNSKAILCDLCTRWIHIKCADFPVERYSRTPPYGHPG